MTTTNSPVRSRPARAFAAWLLCCMLAALIAGCLPVTLPEPPTAGTTAPLSTVEIRDDMVFVAGTPEAGVAARPHTPTPLPETLDGLPVVSAGALPREALDTLERIDGGGPFRYSQDGSVFQNRERRLPDRPRGYYREYTVETPGSPDRGARRIVTGEQGEIYYTADHYDTFVRVIRP